MNKTKIALDRNNTKKCYQTFNQKKTLKQTKVAMGWLFLIFVNIITIYIDNDKYTDLWHFAVSPWAIAVNHWYMKVCDEQVTVASICLLWGFMLKSFTELNSPKTFQSWF